MAIYNPENSPQENLEQIRDNPYLGRLFVQGFVGDVAVQAYMIQGRRESSQNRALREESEVVYSEVFDLTKDMGDPATTIYDALRGRRSHHVVSNGTQIDRVIQYLSARRSFEEA